MSLYFVYTLFSLKDKKLYTGLTGDIRRRLKEHISGKVRATTSRRPIKLIHYEVFINQQEAENREKFLKSGYGRNELKKSLKYTLQRLGYKHLSNRV